MGARILIVDDNALNERLLRIVLERRGYDVRSAANAEAAMQAVRDFRPALILMDLQLPGMDGLELTRYLKGDPATSAIWIVAVTALAMKRDEQRAFEAG